MSKLGDKKVVLCPEELQSISDAADLLFDLAEKIPAGSVRDRAIGHVANLRYIAGIPTTTERFQIRVAMDYAIRKELAGSGNLKRARAETAEAHNVTDGTVNTFYSRHRKVAHKSIETEVVGAVDEFIKRTDALRNLLHFLVHTAE
jgi:hypothetical protein